MKKIAALLLVAAMIVCVCGLAACGGSTETLNILNWGEYIDPELITQFEDTYGIKVKYSTMTSNEEMLVKLTSADNIYDLCFPSDYIIEKLIAQDMLAPLNKENIPNIENIDARFMDLSFDPGNVYSVPYMWGTVGILYNTAMVTEPVTSWSVLWDEQYSGQILMYDSVRDTIGVTLISLGYDLNTRSEDEIAAARDALIAQKPLVRAYATDDARMEMVNGQAAMTVIYSGDAIVCIDENPDLAFAVPEEGSNVWFDNVVIPATSQKQETAELFINFLCDAEVAKRNTEYIGYSTPNAAAFALLDESYVEDGTYNPSDEVLARCEIFHDLGDFIEVYNEAWTAVKTA